MKNGLENLFYLLAGAIACGSAYFYYMDGGGDRVFASFILACCLGFIGYRFHLKKRLADQAELDDRTQNLERPEGQNEIDG